MRNQSFKRGRAADMPKVNGFLITENEEDLVASLQSYTRDNLIIHRV